MLLQVWITHHDETGQKIIWMEEFLDVPRALHMIGKAQTYAQENAKWEKIYILDEIVKADVLDLFLLFRKNDESTVVPLSDSAIVPSFWGDFSADTKIQSILARTGEYFLNKGLHQLDVQLTHSYISTKSSSQSLSTTYLIEYLMQFVTSFFCLLLKGLHI